nr:citrate synthase [uncultured Devosia sp.]
MDWLTASEALALLGTQPQTLYANVSRGRIKARPDPADSRRSLYRGEDVRRLAQRGAGRRKQEAIATQAMQWGEPVLQTAISTIRDGRLIYRGQDAAALAGRATLEDVARLLWRSDVVLPHVETSGQGLAAAFAALALEAAKAPAAPRSVVALVEDAGLVFATMANHLSRHGSESIHLRLARHWQRPDAADVIRRALVLLADHELNASTFSARVTVSTGASLWSGALAGLATLRGPRHGLASPAVTALAQDLGHWGQGTEEALRDWLGEGRYLPGMGHRLYPDGDIRCQALLASFDLPPEFAAYLDAARSISGDEPNVDFALGAMAARFDLPGDSGITLFALARTVGWLAHMMEQVTSGEPIRPRARYVGP